MIFLLQTLRTNYCPAPSFGRLLGPITPGSAVGHVCFPARVFSPFHNPVRDDPDDPVHVQECFPTCPTLSNANATPNITSEPSHSISSVTASSDSSLTPVTCSPSLLLHSSLLPHCNSPSLPPALDLLSPLDSFVPLSLIPIHNSHFDWHSAVETDLRSSDNTTEQPEFFMKAPDLGSASKALIEFVTAIYSGQHSLSSARRAELDVRIPRHSTIAGLFQSGEFLTFHM